MNQNPPKEQRKDIKYSKVNKNLPMKKSNITRTNKEATTITPDKTIWKYNNPIVGIFFICSIIKSHINK